MKKTHRLSICAVAVVAFLTILPFFSASAASNTYVKIGTENIYISSGQKSNSANTATYNASSKTLTLNGFSGNSITTDTTNLKISTVKASSVTSVTSTGNITFTGSADLTISKGVEVSGNLSLSTLCSTPAVSVVKVGDQNVFSTDGKTATTSTITLTPTCDTVPNTSATTTTTTTATTTNPDTLDPIYIYLAVFAVSSAALIVGRLLAKR